MAVTIKDVANKDFNLKIKRILPSRVYIVGKNKNNKKSS